MRQLSFNLKCPRDFNTDITCPEVGVLIYDSSDQTGVAMGFHLRRFLD
jgi:hypothetical protein